MPILCSMDTQVTSLRSPRLPSSFTRYFGTMKQLMPLVPGGASGVRASTRRSEEHTSELQSLMRISYAVFSLKKKNLHSRYAETVLSPHSTHFILNTNTLNAQ